MRDSWVLSGTTPERTERGVEVFTGQAQPQQASLVRDCRVRGSFELFASQCAQVGVDRRSSEGFRASPRIGPRHLFPEQANENLRHSSQTRQGFDQVVIDHHYSKEYEKNECGLVDALFNGQTDFLLHKGFDEEQQDDAAVENWNRQ
jgi:hypothetical protein